MQILTCFMYVCIYRRSSFYDFYCDYDYRCYSNKRVMERINRINNDSVLNSQINNTNSRVNAIDNRVEDLEKTQYVVSGEMRLYDSQKWQINAFTDYSTTRNQIDRTGIKVTFKIGTSYEERRLNELEKKIGILTEEKAQSNTQITPNGETGLKIQTSF